MSWQEMRQACAAALTTGVAAVVNGRLVDLDAPRRSVRHLCR